MDTFIAYEGLMKTEISKEEYKNLIKIEEKYTLLVLGLLKRAKLFSGKMFIISAEEVLAIVDPLEYQKRLEELVEGADG